MHIVIFYRLAQEVDVAKQAEIRSLAMLRDFVWADVFRRVRRLQGLDTEVLFIRANAGVDEPEDVPVTGVDPRFHIPVSHMSIRHSDTALQDADVIFSYRIMGRYLEEVEAVAHSGNAVIMETGGLEMQWEGTPVKHANDLLNAGWTPEDIRLLLFLSRQKFIFSARELRSHRKLNREFSKAIVELMDRIREGNHLESEPFVKGFVQYQLRKMLDSEYCSFNGYLTRTWLSKSAYVTYQLFSFFGKADNRIVGLDILPYLVAFQYVLFPETLNEPDKLPELPDRDSSAIETWQQQKLVVIPVQVNGTVRGQLKVPHGLIEDEAAILEQALAVPDVARHCPKKPKRVIYKPGRILSLVT